MKKQILILAASAAVALSASAQGLVAGWDFADVPNLYGTDVNGYVAEKFAFNNGVSTTGVIISTLTELTETVFAANGKSASNPQFNDGFDATTTNVFGGAETGQQSLNFYAPASAFDIVFNFTSAYDVVINADWLTATTGGATDILNISYSSDGTSWNTYDKANGQYTALSSTAGWTESDGNAGGFIGFVNGGGQSDMVIDLSGVTSTEADVISYVRFEFTNLVLGERVGLDNVHIAGTAVPEPSAYAAIFGALALAFTTYRRRR